MAKVKIEIRLGNAAMSAGTEVAEALRTMANRIESYDEGGLDKLRGTLYTVRDANGNRVGDLRVTS